VGGTNIGGSAGRNGWGGWHGWFGRNSISRFRPVQDSSTSSLCSSGLLGRAIQLGSDALSALDLVGCLVTLATDLAIKSWADGGRLISPGLLGVSSWGWSGYRSCCWNSCRNSHRDGLKRADRLGLLSEDLNWCWVERLHLDGLQWHKLLLPKSSRLDLNLGRIDGLWLNGLKWQSLLLLLESCGRGWDRAKRLKNYWGWGSRGWRSRGSRGRGLGAQGLLLSGLLGFSDDNGSEKCHEKSRLHREHVFFGRIRISG